MKRREFITLLGGAAAWPVAARGQQADRKRIVGVLVPLIKDDASARKQVGAFVTKLRQMGWADGGNARIEVRWAGPIPSDIRRHAAELVALGPDVVLAYGSSTVSALLQLTRTLPIVFPVMGDPVAAGYVESLARPGGNVSRAHWAASGWSCSGRLPHASLALPCCSTQQRRHLLNISYSHLKLRPGPTPCKQ
jgi:ABC-type uncharacterized transport system substrate-binding protein